MIITETISELPLFGPEEQINKFINFVDTPGEGGTLSFNGRPITQETLT